MLRGGIERAGQCIALARPRQPSETATTTTRKIEKKTTPNIYLQLQNFLFHLYNVQKISRKINLQKKRKNDLKKQDKKFLILKKCKFFVFFKEALQRLLLTAAGGVCGCAAGHSLGKFGPLHTHIHTHSTPHPPSWLRSGRVARHSSAHSAADCDGPAPPRAYYLAKQC